jgi:UPF0755 protein
LSEDWFDPSAGDPSAREREARRAEREARRRAHQESLAEKVREQEQESPPTPVAPPPRSEPRPSPPAEPGRRVDQLLVRRLVAVALVLGAAALLVFGAVKALDRIRGEDQPAAAPPKPVKVEDVTIPEGLDRRQIAELTEEAGLRGDYVDAARRFKGFDPAKFGAEDPPHLDGFLFPDTYRVERNTRVEDLVAKQLDALEQNLAGVDFAYAKSKNLTEYDVLKIASMVEREIQVPEERKLAAAVIYNRLAAGDTLGIDATIRYEDQNYDEQLTQSRLAEPTPYNTRVNPGLPPTPIGNPGLASIEAAANPARSDAYFFVVKPGSCNEHVFVETEAEFARAEAEYQAALQAEGGSPTEC